MASLSWPTLYLSGSFWLIGLPPLVTPLRTSAKLLYTLSPVSSESGDFSYVLCDLLCSETVWSVCRQWHFVTGTFLFVLRVIFCFVLHKLFTQFCVYLLFIVALLVYIVIVHCTFCILQFTRSSWTESWYYRIYRVTADVTVCLEFSILRTSLWQPSVLWIYGELCLSIILCCKKYVTQPATMILKVVVRFK